MFMSYKYLGIFTFIFLYACQKGVDVKGKSSKIKVNMEIKSSSTTENAADSKESKESEITTEEDPTISVEILNKYMVKT